MQPKWTHMKTSRLQISLVALFAMVALALTGCGGGDPEPETPATTQPVNCALNPNACK